MKILVVPDSFKDCLTAKEVANNIEIGILKVLPNANVVKIPISDGGEGLLDALIEPLNGELITVNVRDPLNRIIKATYGIIKSEATAIIEMAKASGLELLSEEERNPLITSSFGTGQLIKDALDKGCSKIIIGLGGSATNDAGKGMIEALGGRFLNSKNKEIGNGGGSLSELYSIDLSNLDSRIFDCEVIGACDVSNPLTGMGGASFVYGVQKGGSNIDLKLLDENLKHFSNVLEKKTHKNIQSIPGAGAAGGLGFALIGFLKAKLRNGIDLIMDLLQIEEQINNANIVITGEGKIDSQTLNGKTITGIARLAKENNVSVIAITGKIGDDIEEIYELGITSIYSIVNKPMKLEEAISNVKNLIQKCTENIIRTIKLNSNA